MVIRRRHSTEPLGISIAGGFGSALGDVPIFIAAVDDNGPAFDKLRIGERIITINGQSAERISHNECAQMLRASPQNVNLEVFSIFVRATTEISCEDLNNSRKSECT